MISGLPRNDYLRQFAAAAAVALKILVPIAAHAQTPCDPAKIQAEITRLDQKSQRTPEETAREFGLIDQKMKCTTRSNVGPNTFPLIAPRPPGTYIPNCIDFGGKRLRNPESRVLDPSCPNPTNYGPAGTR